MKRIIATLALVLIAVTAVFASTASATTETTEFVPPTTWPDTGSSRVPPMAKDDEKGDGKDDKDGEKGDSGKDDGKDDKGEKVYPVMGDGCTALEEWEKCLRRAASGQGDVVLNPCRGLPCDGEDESERVLTGDSGIDTFPIVCHFVCIRSSSRPNPPPRYTQAVKDDPILPPAEYGYPTTSDTPPSETFVTDYTPPIDRPYEVRQCPGADDPAYDPNDPECW